MEEATQGDLLSKIRPPRLEDAGLEDCALPPEAIKEAFFKAANSIRSWTASDEGCVQDPKPREAKLSDTLIGIAPTSEPGKPCGNEVGGGLPDVLGDEVAVGISGAQNEEDDSGYRVLGLEVPEDGSQVGKKKACVEGLQGLDIEDNDVNDGVGKDDEEGEEKEREEPILIGAYM